MKNTSMDDAGCCLLSVAWNMAPYVRPDEVSRGNEIRAGLLAVCRSAGRGAREWAETHGPGTEAEYLPFLRLADVAYEIDTLVGLVNGSLIEDQERDLRRWAEVEGLVVRADELAGQVTEFLRAPVAAYC